MKKIVNLLIIAAIMAACAPKEPQYVIKGNISGADSVTFILQKRVAGKYEKLDSAMVLNGTFTIKGGKVEYPEMVVLMAKNLRKGMQFYLENSEITITGNIDSLYDAKVTGSLTQDEYKGYQESLKAFSEKNRKLYEDYQAAEKAGDKAKVAELEKASEDMYKEKTNSDKEFIKSHPASYVSPMILNSISYELEAEEIETFIAGLDTTVAKVQMVKDLAERAAVMKTVSIGKTAPDFTLNDVNDKPLALSSVIGKSKVLLVDFWASWCGPCRQENPNVVKVWKEFNKKGFDVFGVSLDRPGEKDKWMQAIKDDQLTWNHVSDLKFWDCEAAKLYAVRAIPANFLLDEKGTIIAKNLRGEDLAKKVKEILSAK
ncbi:MAG: TlpA disulfide reductase family protein [Bacteroidales bacterium]